MSFIDFAEVKARCSIEQAGKLLDLKTTEERSQLRAPSPVCGGGPRAIVITPAKNLFHCFPSKAGGDQIALVSHVKSVSQKGRRGLDARAISARYVQDGKVTSTGTSTVPPHDHFPPLDYLKFDHVTVESLGIASDIAEALGIGYAPKGKMKGYVAIPIRLPTGELTGYIGITEGKVPKEFHLSKVVTFPKKTAYAVTPLSRGFSFSSPSAR